MRAFEETAASKSGRPNEDDLRVSVTFRRPDGQPGPTKLGAPISTPAVEAFKPDPVEMDLALAELGRRGFMVTARGQMTASLRCDRTTFEKVFGTNLTAMSLDVAGAQFKDFLFPPDDAPWNPDPTIRDLIDDAYIQWPHIYMGRAATLQPAAALAAPISAVPPPATYHHLNVPGDVARLLRATPVHQAGVTGKGVRVAMIDSGFAHDHPYFPAHAYSSSVVLAPRATNRAVDLNGHGTGESANVFAVAPGCTFIGVKLDNDADPRSSASIHEGLLEALKHNPHIITVSLGYDLRESGNQPSGQLPRSLAALQTEIQAAIARGVIVIFSAGNGHYTFPGQMPEVISAGGVFVDANGQMTASDYASAFPSRIYPGRTVPDVCGLVGMAPHAAYIMFPQPPGSLIDADCAAFDETTQEDGWAAFSGTSAAAPQLAGVCALLLQAHPGLTPTQVKAILRRTGRDVTIGRASRHSDPSGTGGIPATVGEDGATGAGLVDAFAAYNQVR